MANNKDTELESIVVEILLDPQIRQSCGIYVEKWMFSRHIHINLVETMMTREFKDKPINEKTLRLYMQNTYDNIYNEDWKYVDELIKSYSPVSSEDIPAVTSILGTFIKNKTTLKGIDLFTKGKAKESEKFFLRATSFDLTPDPFINPLQEGIIDHLKQKDLPPGGKIIQSSLGLINSALQYHGYKNGDLIMTVLRPKGGKSLGRDTPVLMFDGNVKKVQDIKTGDLLMGPDSTPRTVLGTHSDREMMYDIIPNKGDTYTVNESHILSLVDTINAETRRIVNISVRDFLKQTKTFKHRAKGWRTGVFFPKHSDSKSLVITPYFLGLWLGDGTSAEASICTADNEICEYVRSFAKGLELSIRETQKYNNKASMLHLCETKGRANILLQEFRKYGLIENKTKEIKNPQDNLTGFPGVVMNKRTGRFETSICVEDERIWLGTYDTAKEAHLAYNHAKTERYKAMNENCLPFKGKHVPSRYKTGSVEERLELLAGILDTDGYLSTNNGGHQKFDLIQKNEQLLDDIIFIARSLGFACYKKECEKSCQTGATGTYYRCMINGPIEIIPTKVERKRAKSKETTRDRNHLVTGISIVKKEEGEYFGFELDGDGLFLLGDFTVTHNSTFMIQEGAAAANQEAKVAHIHLGDFSEFDSICKYMSCITGDPISDVINAPKHYTSRCKAWLEHIRVAAFPAMSLDTDEVIAYCRTLRKKFKFDVLIIDYDANIRAPEDMQMYETGGYMYSTFKGFGQEAGHVTHIGCQPKIQFWKEEVLPFEAAAESSRKQHAVDVMITGGRNEKHSRIGTFSLPLVRRGASSGITRVRFDDIHSRILEINQKDYDLLLQETKNAKQEAADVSLENIRFEDKIKEVK